MSAVVGLDAVKGKLSSLDRLVKQRLDEAVEAGARQMQSDMVALVPRRTGRLVSALQSDDAVRLRRRSSGVEASVGFNTPSQKKKGYYGFWVETGTKGYVAGQFRSAGVDKRGRKRNQRIKRNVPSRPAQPFFRPALINLRRNMARLRNEAWSRASMDMMLGR